MDIGIIDNDLEFNSNYPNIALEKISSYHKSIGDNVELTLFKEIDPFTIFPKHYDKIYVGKVFTKHNTPKWINDFNNVKIGGSGFFFDKAERLPYEIEHRMPDYNLYNSMLNTFVRTDKHKYYTDYSIGFTTRGCIRRCGFCINKNEKSVYKHSELSEFVDDSRPFIMLFDDNIVASDNFNEIFEKLNSTGKRFVYKQGMDFRLLTKEKIQIIVNSNYFDVIHFAFDNVNDYNRIEDVFKLYKQVKNKRSGMFFYVLIGFDRKNRYDNDFFKQDLESLFIRMQLLFKYHAYPYIMMHENIKLNPYYKSITQLVNTINCPMYINNKNILTALELNKAYNAIDMINKLDLSKYFKIGFFSSDEKLMLNEINI